MPTLPEILGQLQFITQEAALLGLFITAAVILIGRDWRSLIVALLGQYILVGIILSRLVRPDIATLKVMIGAFICPVLFLSARQVSFQARPDIVAAPWPLDRGGWRGRIAPLVAFLRGQDRRRRPAATGFVFRLFTACLMILVTTTLSRVVVLPGLSGSVNTAVFWLIIAGLVTLTITEEPLKVGLGLFTSLTGFELFFTTLESSLLLTGLWGTVNLMIALAIGYLAIIKGAGPEEEEL